MQRSFLNSTALALVLGVSWSGLVLSGTGAAQAQTATGVIDVPSQPLHAAIAELAQETGLKVSIASALAAGKTSTAISGPLTADQALRVMLEGTGLSTQSFADSQIVTARIASQNADDTPVDLGTLVLQGELLDRTIQETQSSVVVSTDEELEQRGETSVDQVLQRIPGVYTTNRLRIRGISDDGGLGNGTSSSTISITTDGIRLTDYRNAGNTAISTWDVEQVEVFRGSQSTNQGRNALAGAIVVEGAKPAFFPEYKLRLGIVQDEDFDDEDDTAIQAAFVLNTPLIEDQLAFRLSGDYRGTDGQGDINNRTVRAGLLYEPTDRLSFDLTYTDIDNGLDTGGENSEQKFQSPRLNIDYDINSALTFSSRTQYTDANPLLILGLAGLGSIVRDREYETIDQEFRLLYETENVRAVGGLFYTYIDEFSTADITNTLFGVINFQSEDIRTENHAIYGEVEYDISPQWTIIAGLRYDVEEVVNKSTASRSALNGTLIGSAEESFDNTYDALLPKLGAIYHFDENKTLGLTYQRGYRAGGVGVSVNASGASNTFEFDPEFTDTLELAYRSQSIDGMRTLNANVYFTDWTDQQVVSLDALGRSVIANAGNSRLWGAELDYRQLFNDKLAVFGTVALSKTEYGDVANVAGEKLDGNRFPGAPEVQASLGASYAFDSGFTIGGDINYTSNDFSDPENTSSLANDAYWVTNLNASYQFDNGLSLNAYARNLFDEEYTTQKTATGFISEGPAREVGVFLTAEF